MKKKLLIIALAIVILIFLLNSCTLTDVITVRITNASSVSGAGGIMTVVWTPISAATEDGSVDIDSPVFPYEYEITDYTRDEHYAIGVILTGADLSIATGSDEFDSTNVSNYLVEIVLVDYTPQPFRYH